MAKKIYWEFEEPETDGETGELTGNTVKHTVALSYSYFSGKATITIDESSFDISEKFFSLKGTEQVFRLGECAALLRFENDGPAITVDNEKLIPLENKR